MSKFLRRSLAALEAYVPGEQPQDRKYIKLNTNESPYPPPQSVAAVLNAEEAAKLRLYSDPESRVLKERLARNYGRAQAEVFVSNGSDEILNFAFMAYGEQGVRFADITYGFYSVFANLYGLDAEVIPLREDFSLDAEAFCGKDGLTVITNPNAPTGMALPLAAIEEIVSSSRGVVLVDEAYVDFGAESAVNLIDRYDNLLVVQTFSKSRSMAGARLGFAFGNAALIADLERIKYATNPYNINRLTQAAGAQAYLVNTGWNGTGKRISIKDTRAIIDAILNGSLDNAETFTLPMFNLQIPTALPGVDTQILDPRSTYGSPEQWQEKADQLAKLFIENFEKYTDTPAGAALVAAGPQR